MFGIFATITIIPEQREHFLSTIRDTALRSVRDEPGCVRFDVFRDRGNENRYLLYEVYTDETAFQTHLSTPHARRAMEGSNIWAESPFDATRADSIYPDSETAFETISSGT